MQKRRIKRSEDENNAKPGRENKHRARRKRQAAETVEYDLGKKNAFSNNEYTVIIKTTKFNCIDELFHDSRASDTT